MRPHILGSLLFLLSLEAALPCRAQVVFRGSHVTFPHQTFEAATEAALQHHDGDLLIYFYRSAHPGSEKIERSIFGYARIADYINRSFSRYAVNLDSEEGEELLRSYHPEVPEKEVVPFFVLDLRELGPPAQYHMAGGGMITDLQLEETLRWIRKIKITDPLTGAVGRGQ